MKDFAAVLIDWQRAHGRHDLPWQNTRDPYRVWLSEIMLQQTQVATVIPYFERFIARFPDVASLAGAPLEAVMPLWAGLGYYARARNLHRAAQQVMRDFGGRFPPRASALAELPGVGRSTAAAIAAFCFGERAAILDGNVKRVLTRAFGIEGFPGEKAVETGLWRLAESLLPEHGVAAYTQALMDLGATVCTRAKPACARCPLFDACEARLTDRVSRLPTPRPKKPRPHRAEFFLLIRHGDAVLLQQRAPTGIWGGLLCLPEWAGEGDLAGHLRQHFGLDLERVAALPALQHGFTHFELELRPVLCEVAARPLHPAAECVWLNADERAQAALPAPIRKLLDAHLPPA